VVPPSSVTSSAVGQRLGIALLGAFTAYLLAAVAGYFLFDALSSNVHDRSVEAAMTSVFVLGPLGAIVGFVVVFIWTGHRTRP
jgi:cation transporter-like permease